jgi:hypothetical protein
MALWTTFLNDWVGDGRKAGGVSEGDLGNEGDGQGKRNLEYSRE